MKTQKKRQKKQNLGVKTLVMRFGHAVVYSRASQSRPVGGAIFYYDRRFPVEVGPFNTASEAIEHWTTTAVSIKQTPIEVEEEASQASNVIFVDFVNKTRTGERLKK